MTARDRKTLSRQGGASPARTILNKFAPSNVQQIVAPTSKSCNLIVRRTAATLRKSTDLTAKVRLCLCLKLLRHNDRDPRLASLRRALAPLSVDDRHYWIGTFYTLLLPPDQRRKQSAYFTPPQIAQHLLALAQDQGVDFKKARILDPAAGGAAFLSMVAARMKELGSTNKSILHRLRGIEIDPMLAALARALIADRLGVAKIPNDVVKVGDALRIVHQKKFDVVLANPPYGRVFPKDLRMAWEGVCHPGHINLYALFVDHCLGAAKPGGTIALLIPSSFIAGPLYCRLRSAIRERSEIKVLAQVEGRGEFFVDVMQDVSLLALAKRARKLAAATNLQDRIPFGRIAANGSWTASGPIKLPQEPSDAWLLPAPAGTTRGGATLKDYGCKIVSGYFVWNREGDRMKKDTADGTAVPLFWACNIKANASCQPKDKSGLGVDYVSFEIASPAIVRGPSLLIQRTTNTKQPRRLIVGMVDGGRHLKSGYVTENHTIVVRPEAEDTNLQMVCKLLNSAAVDRRYRQLSGTASISTLLLRTLDLPTPQNLAIALRADSDFESAVELAYSLSSAGQMAA